MSSPAEAITAASSALSFKGQSWLDRTAIILAVLCGIHCLATPILLVALPLLANTVWVSEHFHLGMLLLVFPTSLLAAFSGCRRHRDRFVIGCIVAGLAVLSFATLAELTSHGAATPPEAAEAEATHLAQAHGEAAGCAACCPVDATDSATIASAGPASLWTGEALLNSLGGLFLVIGHARNFWLCRRHRCDHRSED